MNDYQLFLEKIKSHLNISDLVGRYVKLKKHGNEFTGLCPFHKEKTPSFTVNDHKRFYHCFGCTAHGDVIKFIMEIKKLDFKESVKFLANELSLPLPVFSYKAENLSTHEAFVLLYSINQEASLWFQQSLLKYKSEFVRKYIEERGINNDSLTKFKLGYSSSESNQLYEFLIKKGFNEDDIIKAGLLIKTDKGSFNDRFRGRIIFPIFDTQNRIIAFGGRLLHGNYAKYINSSETAIFNKGETLYGEYFAKQIVREKDRIILVEGYIDVIMMHQIGFQETVATLGTAVTIHHLKRLWNLSKNLIVFLDNDIAGKKAMLRIAFLALENIQSGMTLKFIFSKIGKDPADLCNQSTYEKIESSLKEAVPLSTMLWSEYKRQIIINNSPEEIASLENNLNELLNKINDKTIRENFKHFFKDRVWNELRKKTKDIIPNYVQFEPKLFQIDDLTTRARLEYNLISIIIKSPKLLEVHEILETFSSFKFENQNLQKISYYLIEFLTNNLNQLEYVLSKDIMYKIITDQLLHKELDFLYKNSFFTIDKSITNNQKKSTILFEIIIFKIDLVNMQEEYEIYLKQFTESSIEKAQIVFEEIKLLKEKIAKLELVNYD